MRRVATLASLAVLGLLTCLVPAQPAVAGPTHTALGRRLPEMKFDGIAFGDAMDFIRDVSGQNINVNWKALAEANVTPETTINVRLRDVSLRKVLSLVLSEAGGGDALTFYVEDNVIEVTTKTVADQKIYLKVYPVDDLIVEVPDFTDAPDFNLQANSSQGRGGGGGGGGQQGLLGQNGGQRDKAPSKTKDEKAQELVTLIMETIKPDIWRENGGTASIRYYNGSLIISAPLSVHEMLGGVR